MTKAVPSPAGHAAGARERSCGAKTSMRNGSSTLARVQIPLAEGIVSIGVSKMASLLEALWA